MATIFFAFGVVLGVWATHIPVLQARVGAGPFTLGVALFAMAAGAVLAPLPAGWYVQRAGSRRATTGLLLYAGAVLPLPCAASSELMLFVGAFIFGTSLGSLSVAMNTHASEVELARKLPTLSVLHGLLSLGSFAGSIVGGIIIALGAANGLGAAAISVLLFGLAWASAERLLPASTGARGGRPSFALPNRHVLGLAVLAFLCFGTEGAMMDWSALFLSTLKGASGPVAGLGFALFSLTMAVCRLSGGRIVSRLGERRTVAMGGLLIAVGISLAVLLPGPIASACAFGLVGVGAANNTPLLFGAAARAPGIAPSIGVATVSTCGLGGFVVFPPVIGFAIRSLNMSVAMGLLAVVGAVVCLGAAMRRWSPEPDPPAS